MKKYSTLYLVSAFLIISFFYFFYPTSNSTLDAYAYAASIKYGEDLFRPHQLFYNSFGRVIYLTISVVKPNIDVLAMMKALNAIFGLITLVILSRFLRILQIESKKIYPLLCIVAFSFGFWRFATENDTHLIPICFSMAASYYFLKYTFNQKPIFIFYAALLAGIAVLFHQIHALWWVALAIGSVIYFPNKIREVGVSFAVSFISIMLVYILVLTFYVHKELSIVNFVYFALQDYLSGSNSGNIMLSIKLGPVNFFRSFFQIHGLQFLLFKSNYFWILPGLVSLVLIVLVIFPFSIEKQRNMAANKAIFYTILLVFILHTLAAFYLAGNAEYMAMLPILFLILVVMKLNISIQKLWYFASALLIWNFSYFALPYHSYPFDNFKLISDKLSKYPNANIIVSESMHFQQVYYYKYGSMPAHVLSSPSIQKKESFKKLQNTIDSIIAGGNTVFTDCIHRPMFYNRAYVVNNEINNQFFEQYITTKNDSLKLWYGTCYLSSILPRLKSTLPKIQSP